MTSVDIFRQALNYIALKIGLYSYCQIMALSFLSTRRLRSNSFSTEKQFEVIITAMVASYNLLVIEFNTSRHMCIFHRIRVQKFYSIP